MRFRQNQRGYRCGDNTKQGDTFCANRKPIREKELAHAIPEDLRTLFQTLKEESFVSQLLSSLNTQKKRITKDLDAAREQGETLHSRKREYVHLYTDKVITLLRI